MKIPKEVIKEYVKSENFTNTTDIMESIKSMFADVLNEVLQCEMDEQLGYNKHERTESGEEKKNYRNGSTKRKMKTQLGEVEISVPRDRNGEYEPKIISKYQRNADGLEEKIWCYVKITDTLNLCFLVKSAKCTNWSHLFHGLLDNEPLMA